MEYRRVGRTGLKISEIALGAWLTYGGSVTDDQATVIVNTALDGGINYLDLADIYSKGRAEEVVGRAMRDRTRSDLVISSKVYWPMSDNINDRGLSRKHIMESIDKSLRRIGTDYLDLYFCHRYDKRTEVEEVVCAMDDLVHQGKVLYWGTSVWSAAQIEQAVGAANRWLAYAPAVEQPQYNMFDRHIEVDIMTTCRQNGIGTIAFSPLSQGLLTGKYNDRVPPDSRGGTTPWLDEVLTPENVDKCKKLTTLAGALDLTLAQLALAWILRRTEVSCAIIGATKPEHVTENVAASGTKLSQEMLDAIDEILQNDPVRK